MSPYNDSYLISGRYAKIYILKKKNNLLNKWYWKNWMPACKIMKPDPYFPPCTPPRTGEKAPWLRAIAVFAGDLGSRPSTFTTVHSSL